MNVPAGFRIRSSLGMGLALITMLSITRATPAADAFQASFDCQKAAFPVEKVICGDAELASMDRTMAHFYRRAQSSLNSVERDELRLEQRGWLASRRESCGIPARSKDTVSDPARATACLKGQYEQRLARIAEQLEKRLGASAVAKSRLEAEVAARRAKTEAPPPEAAIAAAPVATKTEAPPPEAAIAAAPVATKTEAPPPEATKSDLPGVEVELFSPQGVVKGVRQVTTRFTAPVVAFGDPRLGDPFDIACPEMGHGRWADPRNWVYDFDRDLPAGVRCTFALKSGLTTINGNAVTAEAPFVFSTGGPAIKASLPDEGDMIDEEQVFILGLDAPVDKASILEHASCEVPGVGERIGVTLLEGKERKQVLEARKSYGTHIFMVKFRHGAERSQVVGWSRQDKTGSDEEAFLSLADGEDSPLVTLRCQRRLPNNIKISLQWGKGIRTPSGLATDHSQRLSFKTRKAFTAEFSCNRANKDAGCMPILPMTLDFSAPVSRPLAEQVTLKDKEGKRYDNDLVLARKQPRDKDGAAPQPTGDDTVNHVAFPGPFPEWASFTLGLPSDFKDDAGRKLENQSSFPLATRTDTIPPLIKFSGFFGILEASDAVLPVTVRNLESVLPLDAKTPGSNAADVKEDEEARTSSVMALWWRNFREKVWPKPAKVRGHLLRVDSTVAFLGWMDRVRDWGSSIYQRGKRPGEVSVFDSVRPEELETFTLPRPEGRKAFEVLGIPLGKPGRYVVELASDRLGAELHGEKNPYFAHTAVLVTNLAAHFKQGRETSLVWVTSLDQGKPVAGAEVKVMDCKGTEYFVGKTDERGIAAIPRSLPRYYFLPNCFDNAASSSLIVTARLGEDETLLLSRWQDGIAPHQFHINAQAYTSSPLSLASTVFDRTLLRAGETVSMKHVLRHAVGSGFVFPNKDNLPKEAVIQFVGMDERIHLPIAWDDAFTAESQWDIPKEAKSGTYQVALAGQISGSFRVEAFRVPTMKASLNAVDPNPAHASRVEMDMRVGYLAGGAVAYAPVKLRGMILPKALRFPEYEGFVFANGAVNTEQEKPSSEDSDNDVSPWDFLEESQRPNGKPELLPVQALTLDESGAARAAFAIKPADAPRELVAEMEYQDANGELLTSSSRVTLAPARVLVGIKPDGWASNQKQFKFHVQTVTPRGDPAPGVQVAVDLFQDKTYSHRKRLIGGFYAYDHHSEIIKLKDGFCQGSTDARGRLVCEAKSPVAGNVVIQARAVDGDGAASFANASVWVTKEDHWWFGVEHHDRMDLLPENKRYEPGEDAIFQVRMPFREATALVTVEREGVLESFVQPLSGKNPTLKVSMRGSYAPNVFVSVLAVRGRVGDPQPTALVDLGKPAFRLGYAELKVGWKAHELGVKVNVERPVYHVREKARVSIQVAAPDGKALPPGTEVSLAAVDEGLLALKPNDSWNLLASMMRQRPLEILTSTAQMQVIGRRHYGRKAVSPGGGGGRRAPGRQLLETLLLWQGRVKLDAQGRAEALIPINDVLGSFRVTAVAHAGADLFGSGETSFRTSQDLMLFSGVPPLTREEDAFQAAFTVRNGGDRPLKAALTATLTASGANEEASPPRTLPGQEVELAPGESRIVTWDIATPLGADKLSWTVEAVAGAAHDKLTVSQKVIPAVAVRVFQATLERLEGKKEMPVERPADALPGRGGVRVQLMDSLAEDLSGVRDYMNSYPYICLEQQLSQAVALRDGDAWARLMNALPAYLDRDGLAKFLTMPLLEGSDTLTTYILAIADDNGWEIPKYERQLMLRGLRGFFEGKIIRGSPMPTADLNLRRLAALEALSRYGEMTTGQIDALTVEPNLWPTSGVIDWINLLKRSESYHGRERLLREAGQVLRSRLNFQGTTMNFSTERNDALWWLMISADVNANRLILTILDDPAWREDLPRLVRGALGRRQHGHWSTTPANAWGVTAMMKFAQTFETEPVAGESAVNLEGEKRSLDWKSHPKGETLDLPWPRGRSQVLLNHQGSGKPWVSFQSRAAIPLKEPFSTGYRILSRTVTPVERKNDGVWSRGDVMRVRLEIEAQADMTWVVVNDPVPAGSAILGTGLSADSAIMTRGESKQGWVHAAFEERAFDAFHAYYQWVPKGKWSVEYTLRLNTAGHFSLPPTRVEAMYAPEMLGELPIEPMTVVP